MVVEGGDPHVLMENEHDNPNLQERIEHSGTSAMAIAIRNTASQMFDLNFRPQQDTAASVSDYVYPFIYISSVFILAVYEPCSVPYYRLSGFGTE